MFIVLFISLSLIFINLFLVYGYLLKFIGLKSNNINTTTSLFQIISLIPQVLGAIHFFLFTLLIEKIINLQYKFDNLIYILFPISVLLGILLGLKYLDLFFKITNFALRIFIKKKAKI